MRTFKTWSVPKFNSTQDDFCNAVRYRDECSGIMCRECLFGTTATAKKDFEEWKTKLFDTSFTNQMKKAGNEDNKKEMLKLRKILRDICDEFASSGCDDCGTVSVDTINRAREHL